MALGLAVDPYFDDDSQLIVKAFLTSFNQLAKINLQAR